MRGEMTVKASDHVVILGYLPVRTERIVRDLITDGRRDVVVCGWEGVTNPFAENEADFVGGDLTEPEVLRRAGIDRARSVLIDARDDNEALAMLVSVHHVNPSIHTVVALRDLSRTDHLKFVHEGARCVQWHTPTMAAEELKDPGIARVYTELMTNRGGNTYSMRLGTELGDVSFGELQAGMGRKHAATVLAVDSGGAELMVSPGWETPIPQGSVIYYVSRHRLSEQDVVAAIAAFAS